jgi:hypothetical protein
MHWNAVDAVVDIAINALVYCVDFSVQRKGIVLGLIAGDDVELRDEGTMVVKQERCSSSDDHRLKFLVGPRYDFTLPNISRKA